MTLWAIQYTPRAAGMMNAKYTDMRGIMYIMDLVLPAPGPSGVGCCFMVSQENSSWLPPARMGMRMRPMTAAEKVKLFTAVQGVEVRSMPRN